MRISPSHLIACIAACGMPRPGHLLALVARSCAATTRSVLDRCDARDLILLQEILQRRPREHQADVSARGRSRGRTDMGHGGGPTSRQRFSRSPARISRTIANLRTMRSNNHSIGSEPSRACLCYRARRHRPSCHLRLARPGRVANDLGNRRPTPFRHQTGAAFVRTTETRASREFRSNVRRLPPSERHCG